MARFNILDQAVLTTIINEEVDTALERTPMLGGLIAPLVNIESRMARMDVGNTYAFGMGQFKAPNAMPALVEMPTVERREAMIELVQLEEMHRINSEQWIRLHSPDERIRNAEGLDVVTRGQILRRRLERLTEWMRWQVFTTGRLTVTYPRTNSTLLIDYGWLSGHLARVTTAWSDHERSTPIEDIERWQLKIAEDSGYLGTVIHLTSQDARDLIQSNSLRSYFNVPSGQPFRVTLDQVASLLADGTRFVVHDAGFRPMSSGAARNEAAHTRYLPQGTVVVTTEYTVGGENIADTLNGQVEISTDYNRTAVQLGPSSEVILDHMTKNRYLREAAARIVRILHPECFLSASLRP